MITRARDEILVEGCSQHKMRTAVGSDLVPLGDFPYKHNVFMDHLMWLYLTQTKTIAPQAMSLSSYEFNLSL